MKEIEKIKKHDLTGGKYYNQLPPGWKPATLDDFYDNRGRLITGRPYLVKSMIHESRYWANRVNERFPYRDSEFSYFLESGFVFVRD